LSHGTGAPVSIWPSADPFELPWPSLVEAPCPPGEISCGEDLENHTPIQSPDLNETVQPFWGVAKA